MLVAMLMAVASFAQVGSVKLNSEAARQMLNAKPDATKLSAEQKQAVVKMRDGKAVTAHMKSVKPMMGKVMKHNFTALNSAMTTRAEGDVVTPPAGLEVRAHTARVTSMGTMAGDYDYGNYPYTINIGIDGEDAYMQGLFYFMPEAWIKGKVNADGSLTFANNQYLGKVEQFDVYVTACSDQDEDEKVEFFQDFTFAYDAAADTYTYIERNTNITFTPAPNSMETYDIIYNIELVGPDAPKDDTTVIWEQPEGELKIYERQGDAYYTFWGYLLFASQQGAPMRIVTNGNDVYMENPISQGMVEGGTWVKGTREGNTIHVPLRQYTYYDEESEFGYFTGVFHLDMVYDEWEEAEVPTYVLTDQKEITFTVDDQTGTIKLDLKSETDPMTLMTDYIYGLAYSYDGSWAQLGDCNTVYVPMNDVATTIPDGAKTETWALMYNDGSYYSATMTNVAIVGDKMYIAGISPDDPESAIVGTMSDGKVTFKSDQYQGLGSDFLAYVTFAQFTTEEFYDEWYEEWYTEYSYTYIPEYTFNYDASKKLLTPSTDDFVMILNAGKGEGEILALTKYFSPEFNFFEEVAAKPANPIIYGFNDWFDDYGYNVFSADVILKDVNGKYIDKEKTTYIVWTKLDGVEEPFTFYGDEYVGLNDALGVDEITEVPYTAVVYDDAGYEDILEGCSYTVLYQSGFDDYGIQTIYYGGGERNTSDIVWLSEATGIKDVADSAKNTSAAMYNMLGQRVNENAKGLIIKNGKKYLVK